MSYILGLYIGIISAIIIIGFCIPIAITLSLCKKFTLDKLLKIYYFLFTGGNL
jgi:hypothetical protein